MDTRASRDPLRASARNCQPKRCAEPRRTRPKAAVGLFSSGTIEQQHPAKSACARSVRKVCVASAAAERSAWTLKRARASGRRNADQRSEQCRLELFPPGADPSQQAVVRLCVRPQLCGGLVDRACDHNGGSVVERMGQGGRRLDHLEPVFRERKLSEEGRARDERMNRRADVVHESGQRQLRRAHASAERVLRLAYDEAPAGASEGDGRCKPVRPDPTTTASRAALSDLGEHGQSAFPSPSPARSRAAGSRSSPRRSG